MGPVTIGRARCVAACLLVVAGGCASWRAAQARQERLRAGLDGLRYSVPPAAAWQEVRRLLADRGFPLAGEDAAAVGQKGLGIAGLLSPARETHPYEESVGLLPGLLSKPATRSDGSVSLDTGWRNAGDRQHVDGLVEKDGFRVVFTRILQDPANPRNEAQRDLEMELELARRLDPAAAASIEAGLPGAPGD